MQNKIKEKEKEKKVAHVVLFSLVDRGKDRRAFLILQHNVLSQHPTHLFRFGELLLQGKEEIISCDSS